ncbi:MAG: hypothetical protein MJ213_05315 [Bacilli bacterium]|nr:hypothetical protein [Bacilli bacterium]
MKKSILLVFTLIPMLASCNSSSNGFPNPFPEDIAPIGFNIQEEGKIVRSLTSQETSLINSTIESSISKNLYSNIKEESITIKARDYTRAFAGVFAQGYDSSNKKIDETYSIYRQDEKIESELVTRKLRNVTETKSTTLYDFSYGRNTVTEENTVYKYLAIGTDPSENKQIEYNEADSIELAEIGGCTFMQTYDGEGETLGPEGAGVLTRAPIGGSEDWYESDVQISQSGFIFNPSTATSLPGVNKDGKPVLIKESHNPYEQQGQKKGIYRLEDGREFQAMNNELIVSTLRLVQPKITNDDPEPEGWYIVDRSRHYVETVITSDVIQPNVPISYLTHPIVVAYTEEIISFSEKLSATHETQKPEFLDEVEIEEEDKI